MVQDLPDHAGLGDERHDAHFAAAVFANQRVGFEHPADQVGPSSAKGFTLSGIELVVVQVVSFGYVFLFVGRSDRSTRSNAG